MGISSETVSENAAGANRKQAILELFKNTTDYLSGQELCERFGVSRTAVWKVINQLKDEGYEIEAVRNRGYRLITCPDVLISEEISSVLTTDWWGRKLLYYEEIDSTNNEIRRFAEQGAKEGLLAIAESQTAGKGRRGRSWSSPKGQNIYMSFLLRPEIEPGAAAMITIVTALAVAEAIRSVTGLDARIKWPNDIVIGGRKITGILTEMSTEMTSIQYVIVGIGINVNQNTFPEEIAATASSLSIECGEPVRRSKIVAAFGEAFERYYRDFLAAGNLEKLRGNYEELLVNRDRQVRLVDQNGEATDPAYYTAVGINEIGELLIRSEAGEIRPVRAGEVSVRGIYGYV